MNDIQVFENEEFGTLRAFERDGTVWFVARDVAKALGMRDAERVTRSLDDDEKGTIIDGTRGGDQKMSTVSEAGFYKVVLRKKTSAIEDPAVADSVRRFQRWVTHDVLPSIRRHGGYMVPVEGETPDQLLARALVVAEQTLRERDRRIAEQAEVISTQAEAMDAMGSRLDEMAPKALFADAVSSSDTSILVGELAKLLRQNGYETGQNRLFETLRDEGYLIKSGSARNMPTQYSAELGLFEVKETTVVHSDGHVTVNRTPKVTGKGQMYFVNRYCGAA